MSAKMPPGPRRPRFLNSLKWQRDPTALMKAGHERYGEIWTLPLSGGTNFVLISDPGLVERVFTADPAVLHGGEAKRQVAGALLGKHSLLLVDGTEHARLRKLMMPAFHRDRIRRYVRLMERICNEELDRWPLREPIPLLPRMQTITLNVIMSVIFGVSGGPEQKLRARIHDLHDFSASPLNMIRLFVANLRGLEPPAGFRKVRAELDAVTFEEIGRARRDPGIPGRDDVLAMLVQARHDDGSPLTDEEVRDQLITLYVQGHTSTAATLSWALERLMRHPEMFERLRAEAQAGKDEYLDAVVKETLRLRPAIPITTRLVREPYPLGGYEIEPGSTIAAGAYMLHHRDDLYPEPERFRPDRFLEQEAGTYRWIPFGGGDRYCIGRSFATAEIRAVLRAIALRTRLAPVEYRDEPIAHRATAISPGRQAMAIVRERASASEADTCA